MYHILIFWNDVWDQLIKDYLERRKESWTIYREWETKNIFFSQDDNKVHCKVSITMPWTINTKESLDIDSNWFPNIKWIEDGIFDYCLDKTPDTFDIDEASVYAEPLDDIKLDTQRINDKSTKFLQELFWGDTIEAKNIDHIEFRNYDSIYDDFITDMNHIMHKTDNFWERYIIEKEEVKHGIVF